MSIASRPSAIVLIIVVLIIQVLIIPVLALVIIIIVVVLVVNHGIEGLGLRQQQLAFRTS